MKHVAAAILGLGLAGCASLSPDAPFSAVQETVKQLLAKPLGPQEAVQIALLNNPARQRAAAEGLRVALDTRKAWFAAVAAQESAKYAEQVKEAAEASAELARRMAAVGNWSKLSQAREQAFYAEATARLARARQAQLSARERLTRLMGLWGEDLAFQLPERLPELPKEPRAAGDLEARSEVRESYAAYRTAFDLARHYRDEVVPLRRRISEEALLRYNGMLMSVFELLADSREQVGAVNGYIETLRDFWLAESDLQRALTAGAQP